MFKYLYHIIGIFSLILVIITTFFLHRNFYQTLAHTKTVATLTQQVSFASLNIYRFTEVIKKLDEKQKAAPKAALTDPFYPEQ